MTRAIIQQKPRRPVAAETPIKFGAVTVMIAPPSAAEIESNIREGQSALLRAKQAFIKTGVKISRPKGKPLYFGSPENPEWIIREVDGVRTVGKYVGGRFRVLPESQVAAAAHKSKAAGTSRKLR